jgi:hypothetical protein
MRVLRGERLQFGVPALQSEVISVQLTALSLQSLNLRIEPDDLLGERPNLALLQNGVGRPIESEPPKGIFKEPEEGVRP